MVRVEPVSARDDGARLAGDWQSGRERPLSAWLVSAATFPPGYDEATGEKLHPSAEDAA